MSIADQLKKLEKDPKFQKRVSAARVAARKSGKPFGKSAVGVSDEAEARLHIDTILNKIHAAILTVLPHMPREMFEVYKLPVTANGEYHFVIYFKAEAVHRESLYREGYPDGLENIVALYSHGSEPTKKAVWNRGASEWDYGTKRQHVEYRQGRHYFIAAGWYKEPDPFLIDAVAAINAQMNKNGIRVKLDAKYYP